MSANGVAFMGWLCHEHSDLMPILEEHLDANDGEVLAHLLMGDITRWVVQNCENNTAIISVLEDLEIAYSKGEETGVSELIAVSFLENLPSLRESAAEIGINLGPNMRAQLSRF